MTDTEILAALDKLSLAFFKVEIQAVPKPDSGHPDYPNPWKLPKQYVARAKRGAEHKVKPSENETLLQQYERKRAAFFDLYDIDAGEFDAKGDTYREALESLLQKAKEEKYI
ncbi:hypothetical protein [Nocardiopsis alba]|uniref:hypothetical protein n=1 Tax=Nocardiopsis alba TaxID=53437 RepID=UPI0033B48ABD